MKPKTGSAKVAPKVPAAKAPEPAKAPKVPAKAIQAQAAETKKNTKAETQAKAIAATRAETKQIAKEIKQVKTGQIKAPIKTDKGGKGDKGDKGGKGGKGGGKGGPKTPNKEKPDIPDESGSIPRQKPMPETPITIMPVPDTPTTPAIKSAPIETVLFNDEKVSDNLLLDLLFEDVGGQELLTMSRHDTVNGQPVAYQPFKNLGILQNTFNPSNLLRLQETSDKFFANFVINLNSKIPKVGNGLNGSNYYLTSSGDLVIEFVNLKSDEEIEIQIVTDGTIDEVGI